MCNTHDHSPFAALDNPKSIWAISSVHGDHERLQAMHAAILEAITPGEKIIYLGNYTGYGTRSVETINEILEFRRDILSIPGMMPKDIVYLRGAQEDLWHRLMQLHFCPNPLDMLLWMLASGLSNSFQSYGIDAHDGVIAAREGVLSITRWLNTVRARVRAHEGHEIFNAQFKRAAYTNHGEHYPALFVNAGIDPSIDLQSQEDALWWGCHDFTTMENRYDPFDKVIRGFDPSHQGVKLNCVTASLDGGCGFGGPLVAAQMNARGDIYDLLQA